MSYNLTIIVPCYNEERRLHTDAFITVLRLFPELSFIFVNDGSDDGTATILDSMEKEMSPRVRILHHATNHGKGRSIFTGFGAAFLRNADFIGYWDADLSTPLDAIKNLIDQFKHEETDIVIGSRVKLLGRDIQRQRSRHIIGRVFATFASMFLNLPVYDTQCGAKIFRNTKILRSVFSRPFTVDWIFDVEIIARFLIELRIEGKYQTNLFIIEYPLHAWKDIDGSKIKPKHYAIAALDMLKLYYNYYSLLSRS